MGVGVILDDGLGFPGAFTLTGVAAFAADTERCDPAGFAEEFADACCKEAGDLVDGAGGVGDDRTTEDTDLEGPSLEATRADLSKNFLY